MILITVFIVLTLRLIRRDSRYHFTTPDVCYEELLTLQR